VRRLSAFADDRVSDSQKQACVPVGQRIHTLDLRSAWGTNVLARLRELTVRARAADLVLLHGHARGIYGETLERCLDVPESINGSAGAPGVRSRQHSAVWADTLPDRLPGAAPWLCSIHEKDACADEGAVVAGESLACIAGAATRECSPGSRIWLRPDSFRVLAARRSSSMSLIPIRVQPQDSSGLHAPFPGNRLGHGERNGIRPSCRGSCGNCAGAFG
jgi:hypothetical protein